MKTKKRKNAQFLRIYRKMVSLFNSVIERISKIEIKQNKSTNKSNKNTRIKRNLSKKIKKETIEPIESWTLHGLPNVFRTKYFSLKIIWIILFSAALGGSIYFLYNTIKEYLQYEVTTVVRSINVDELDFPVITICNTNQISNQKGLDYFLSICNRSGYNYDLQSLSDYFAATGDGFYTYVNSPSVLFYEIPIKERKYYSATMDQMLMTGGFNDEHITAKDFNWFYHPHMGNCYQLNTDSKLKAKTYQNNVISLIFDLTLPPIVQEYGFLNSMSVFLKSKTSNIYRLKDESSFEIQSGRSVSLKITKSVFNKQKKPYSDCDFVQDDDGNFEYPSWFDRKYYDQIKSAGYEYSQSMCISFCQIDKIKNDCTFRASSLNAPNNMDNFCPNKSLNFLNSFQFLYNFYLAYYYNKELDAECAKFCPLECNTENYDVSLITKEFSSDNKNYIDLYINYNSLSYYNYDESPSISVYNLVSNIGGAIGLLLGMSLLSIFEILEMIVLSIILIVQHKYKSFKLKRRKPNELVV